MHKQRLRRKSSGPKSSGPPRYNVSFILSKLGGSLRAKISIPVDTLLIVFSEF